jgi:chemotaxis protein CheD
MMSMATTPSTTTLPAPPILNKLTVGVGDMIVSADPTIEIVTFSLGSCIGLTIWDPVTHAGGLLHLMLPSSRSNPDKGRQQPAMFADTGIPRLFRSVYDLGGAKKRLIVKMAGGSACFPTQPWLDIGQQNLAAVRKLFWKNNVLIDGQHIRENLSRTMRLNLATGKTTIENAKLGKIEI